MTKSKESSEPIKGSTSLIRRVPTPMQTKFCRSAQEFHEDRALSLHGVDPRTLHGDNDILDKEWTNVFTCPKPGPGSSKKVKAYHVKPQFAEALVQKHWAVYQEGPVMYEIGQQFAKAFAMENCVAAKSGKKKEDYVIDWAHFAERAMKNSEDRHHLANKRKRWEDHMLQKLGPRDGHGCSFGREDSWTTLQETRRIEYEQGHRNQVIRIKQAAHDRMAKAEGLVEDAKMKLDAATRELHRAEGAQSHSIYVTALQGEISSLSSEYDRERLLKLMESFKGTGEEDLSKLQQSVEDAKVCHVLEFPYIAQVFVLYCLPLCNNLSIMD